MTAALVAVHSAVPGRVRYRLATPRTAELQEPIEAAVAALPGVRRVELNPLTATLLVVGEPATVDGGNAELAAVLSDVFGHELRLAAPPIPELPGEAVPLVTAGVPVASTWHTRSIADIAADVETSARRGLAEREARRRFEVLGPNAVPPVPAPGVVELLRRQLDNVPTKLLAGSAAFSVLTGGLADAAVIAAVVGLNASIGYLTEQNAEAIIRSLRADGPRTSVVIRGGKCTAIPADEVVRGDLLVLRAGMSVAADARLVGADRLLLDESSLTGESEPVQKDARARLAAGAALADRLNMVYRGTLVTGGEGTAIVVACGSDTEMGRIQRAAQELEAPQTPIQQQLDRVGQQLAIGSAAACGLVFVLGLLRGQPIGALLRTAISLAVAAVPEGLPAVATTTLALGVQRLRARRVAVRRLDAIEALGTMRTLCLDKTGTLTENRMRVRGTLIGTRRVGTRAAMQPFLEVLALCNGSESHTRNGVRVLVGSATENALLELVLEHGIDVAKLRTKLPRVAATYHSAERPFMVSSHRLPSGGVLLAVKGGPAEVLAQCTKWSSGDRALPLDDRIRDRIVRMNDEWAGRAMRVLAVASARLPDDVPVRETPFTFLGLVALADPVRSEVPELISRLHEAGIETVMITGDQAKTARAIAAQLDLAQGAPLHVWEPSVADDGEAPAFAARLPQARVFARVSPVHKLRIVQGLQRAGRIVAMTGDGVNDGPALRAANIGIAMGGGRHDVARSLADLVLEDDDLRALLEAIREGRTIYGNIRKAIRYLLSTNFSEIETMLASLALGLPTPLNPMQLLWLNLLTDVLPALALALEPAEPDTLHQPPRDADEPILGRRDLPRLLGESTLITAGTLLSYGYAVLRHGPGARSCTQAFGTLTLAQLLHAFSSRSDRFGLFVASDRPRNRYLDAAIGGSILLQLGALALPWTRRLLGTTPLGPLDLAVMAAGAVLPYVGNEWIKHGRSG